jgi:hypothetical protein
VILLIVYAIGFYYEEALVVIEFLVVFSKALFSVLTDDGLMEGSFFSLLFWKSYRIFYF